MLMGLVARRLFFTGVLAITNMDVAPVSRTAWVGLMDMAFALCLMAFCVEIELFSRTSTKYRCLLVEVDEMTILLLS